MYIMFIVRYLIIFVDDSFAYRPQPESVSLSKYGDCSANGSRELEFVSVFLYYTKYRSFALDKSAQEQCGSDYTTVKSVLMTTCSQQSFVLRGQYIIYQSSSFSTN